jgi:hypothetical protein
MVSGQTLLETCRDLTYLNSSIPPVIVDRIAGLLVQAIVRVPTSLRSGEVQLGLKYFKRCILMLENQGESQECNLFRAFTFEKSYMDLRPSIKLATARYTCSENSQESSSELSEFPSYEI